jgi:hypothetical protein
METSSAKAAAREKAKLEQMEIDGKTPLFPGCRPEDTRLSVTLKALEMKVESKWTCHTLSTTPASMIAHFIGMSMRRESHVRCAAKDDTR